MQRICTTAISCGSPALYLMAHPIQSSANDDMFLFLLIAIPIFEMEAGKREDLPIQSFAGLDLGRLET